ncbi:cytochrome P450 [Streptomyces sp. NRRL S-87]|uniref:cytochrome P450 n=1 Tax=Streptomyces sp. NRRL S-87 TaxID=1463920 RepID=UPI0004C0B715|nr:cytochrome P450 [Streptomyces sp. NRRL S-87]
MTASTDPAATDPAPAAPTPAGTPAGCPVTQSGPDTGGATAPGARLPVPRTARASRAETLRFVATHTLPAFVRGVVVPRGPVLTAYAALDQAAWSAATLRALRDRHGGAPVRVRGLSGEVLVLLDPADVRRFFALPVPVLAMDAADKNRAFSAFEPDGVLCTHGELRERLRRVNDEVLGWDQPVHPSCAEYLAVVEEECASLTHGGTLPYGRIQRVLTRISRRIVLGDRAAGDEEFGGWLHALRAEANWMGLRKGRRAATRALYERASARIAEYAADAPAHTLAARALRADSPPGTDPLAQTHHWLAALDACAPVTARTLMLLAAHPAEQECAALVPAEAEPQDMDRLRACVQESLRLYPLVPDLLRVTRAETEWRGVHHPAGTTVLVPIGFHQRDPAHVPGADLFVPGRWLRPGADRDTATAPFSHGGGRCPGDQLGLLLTAAVCARVLRGHRVTGARPHLDPVGPLPGAVDTPAIRLTLRPR